MYCRTIMEMVLPTWEAPGISSMQNKSFFSFPQPFFFLLFLLFFLNVHFYILCCKSQSLNYMYLNIFKSFEVNQKTWPLHPTIKV